MKHLEVEPTPPPPQPFFGNDPAIISVSSALLLAYPITNRKLAKQSMGPPPTSGPYGPPGIPSNFGPPGSQFHPQPPFSPYGYPPHYPQGGPVGPLPPHQQMPNYPPPPQVAPWQNGPGIAQPPAMQTPVSVPTPIAPIGSAPAKSANPSVNSTPAAKPAAANESVPTPPISEGPKAAPPAAPVSKPIPPKVPTVPSTSDVAPVTHSEPTPSSNKPQPPAKAWGTLPSAVKDPAPAKRDAVKEVKKDDVKQVTAGLAQMNVQPSIKKQVASNDTLPAKPVPAESSVNQPDAGTRRGSRGGQNRSGYAQNDATGPSRSQYTASMRDPSGNNASNNRRPPTNRPAPAVIPQTDFDFTSSNAKFDKTAFEGETTEDVEIPSASPREFYSKSSFFDNISSEAKERTSVMDTNQNQRYDRQKERAQNLDTFGETGKFGRGRGRGRGGPFRGNRVSSLKALIRDAVS